MVPSSACMVTAAGHGSSIGHVVREADAMVCVKGTGMPHSARRKDNIPC